MPILSITIKKTKSMQNNTVDNQTETAMYAIFRNGIRVSDSEYDSKLDAQREYEYWAGIIKRNPDGSKLDVRQLNYRR
jgi:hypothetical protein